MSTHPISMEVSTPDAVPMEVELPHSLSTCTGAGFDIPNPDVELRAAVRKAEMASKAKRQKPNGKNGMSTPLNPLLDYTVVKAASEVGASSKSSPQARNWLGTTNNMTSEWMDTVKSNTHLYRYWRGQPEIGEDCGTPHVQCYVQMPKQMRLTQMVNLFPGSHLEIQRGTVDYAYKYVTKDETTRSADPAHAEFFFEYGTMMHAGDRSDILGAIDKALAGATASEIARSDPLVFVRNCRVIKELCEILHEEKKRVPLLDADGKIVKPTVKLVFCHL